MSSKSDIIYRKLVLAHKLISDSELLKCIVDVKQKRSDGSKISLLEFLLKKNLITPDDGLILRSEHDKVVKMVKEKTRVKKQNTESFENTVNITVEENADQILSTKTNMPKKQSQNSGVKRKRSKSQAKSQRKSKSSLTNSKVIDEDKTLILPSPKRGSKSSIRNLEVDADPDLLQRNNYDPAKDPLVGKTFGGCKLISKIGEGGMGSVYKAYHIGLDKHVALKLLPPSHLDSADRVKRFKHEAKSAAKMEHPNIVQILNIGEQDNVHFIVMQYIDGEDLRQRLLRKGVFPPIDAIDICIQVAEGLSVAHKKGIVHRDIKPDNIMIEREGNIKITDFGLARQIEKSLDISKPGKALGTPYYMSPEQCSGQELDGRSDIYSLGVTLYHIVTGRRPFKGKNAVSTALMHIREPVTPPEKINPNLPLMLADLILKMMEKNPKDRFQTSQKLVDELKRVKNAILNEIEDLDQLIVTEKNDQSSRIVNTVVTDNSSSKNDLTGVYKQIAIFGGIGIIALVAAIVLFTTVFTGNGDPGINNPPGNTGKTPSAHDILQKQQKEKEAKEAWDRLKKDLAQIDKTSFHTLALKKIDNFIEKYKDMSASEQAENFKKRLIKEYIREIQNVLTNMITDYDKLIAQKKFVDAKKRIMKINPDLLTDEIKKERAKRLAEVDSLISGEWIKIYDKVNEFVQKEPYQYFDALNLLKNTDRMGDPIFDEPLKYKTTKVEQDLQKELDKIRLSKLEELKTQIELKDELEKLLDSKLKDVKFNSENFDELLETVKKSIKKCDKYSYVLPTFKLIERDLMALKYFQDEVINQIFGDFAKRNKSIDITLADGTSYHGEVKKSDINGIELKSSGVSQIYSWNQLSPAFLAETAFNRIKPRTNEIRALAVPLYLLSVDKHELIHTYINSDQLAQSTQEKIAWRFNKPRFKKDFNLFSIYKAEILGLRALSMLLGEKKEPFMKNLNESLRLNPHSGWGNIVRALAISHRDMKNRAEDFLNNVQEEYTKLKEYLKLYAQIKISKKEYSQARTYLNSLNKNFAKDEDVMILWATLFMEEPNKSSLAQKILLEAQGMYPYNKQIWQMLQKFK